MRRGLVAAGLGAALLASLPVSAQLLPPPENPVEDPIPPRREGEGPYARLILRGATMVDGTGGPAQGPVDIVIEKDRIAAITPVGAPGRIEPKWRPAPGDREIDMTGYYVLPGFIDTHVHLHSLNDPQGIPSEYELKLWLMNGITSVRELGSDRPLEWLLDIKARSARNAITAPRIDVYPFLLDMNRPLVTPEDARARVREYKARGADGIKLGGITAPQTLAAIDETKKLGMHSTMHHDQTAVSEANVLDTSAAGLEGMEHWYGLPEALFTDRSLQHYSPGYVYQNEQDRFGEAGRLWAQAARPGSARWNEVMETLLERDFIITPTFVPYIATRDLQRSIHAPWQADYTLPALWDFWRPDPINHGSFWFDWTTEDEVAWKENFRLWMQFINEYKNRGGTVPVGDDAGYLYNLPGFGFIQELELLREAGFTPLEVIRAATQSGARALGHEDQVGTLELGKKADIIAVKGNPLANLKLLYPTGTIRLDPADGKVHQVGGIDYIIKDGIVFEGATLRRSVRDMVTAAKAERGLEAGAMPVAMP